MSHSTSLCMPKANRNHQTAFQRLYLTTSLGVLLYSQLALHHLMSQQASAQSRARSHTQWTVEQDSRMISILTALKPSIEANSTNFKAPHFSQVAGVLYSPPPILFGLHSDSAQSERTSQIFLGGSPAKMRSPVQASLSGVQEQSKHSPSQSKVQAESLSGQVQSDTRTDKLLLNQVKNVQC